MGSRPDALRVAIERAWQVFDLPAPATTGVCEHCCMDPAIESAFLKTPARDLPLAFVRDWYFAAFSDAIAPDHVAWFLPRVLELLAEGETVAYVGNEVALSRLPLTGFPVSWPKEQVAAVSDWALALVADWLPRMGGSLGGRQGGDRMALDDTLCMISNGGLPLEPHLAQMSALPDADLVALLHRNWVFTRADGRPACVVWTTSFWDDLAAREAVQTFYTGPVVMAALDRELDRGNAQAAEILGT